MNIVIVAPHQWPIPTPAHTGHIVIWDLAQALVKLGHDVKFIAPAGTKRFGGSGGGSATLLDMPCSNGTASPTAMDAEHAAIRHHMDALKVCDIIHDWSVEKSFAEMFPDKTVSTVMSGNFDRPKHGRNVVVWSKEMQARAYRGASDYEGTEFSQWHSTSRALADARVVPGGVDTEFWCPDSADGQYILAWSHQRDHILWLGRWHPARGYALAIETARKNPHLEFVMAGEHPKDALNEHQRECAIEAEQLAAGVPNVRIEWLPKENHREAVREQHRRAKAFLFVPRFREPFGLSQAEALACGTPVIGTNIGSVPEVIEHGVTGFVVEPAFLAQACEKIGHIDPAKCRSEAVRRFDRSVMAKNYLEQYQAVVDGKGWG